MDRQLDLFADVAPTTTFGNLDEARTAARACVRCNLATTRQQVVFGEGAATARLVIVGEGPSEADDASGRPFSGPSGQLLGRWLQELGLSRKEVWLTNVVRCRPTAAAGGRLRNRPPQANELTACRPWLDAELALLRPEAVLCVGATAGRALIGRDFKMTRDRGQWRCAANGTPTLATYNPAYVLRLEGDARQRAEAEVAADLASVRDRLRV
ncbi:MAG TPA: uracil-DNA glycosylase [Chloroflexota bacterium]|nr:uracil-DNA glycosylase [Chloroflexota bacterium]